MISPKDRKQDLNAPIRAYLFNYFWRLRRRLLTNQYYQANCYIFFNFFSWSGKKTKINCLKKNLTWLTLCTYNCPEGKNKDEFHFRNKKQSLTPCEQTPQPPPLRRPYAICQKKWSVIIIDWKQIRIIHLQSWLQYLQKHKRRNNNVSIVNK